MSTTTVFIDCLPLTTYSVFLYRLIQCLEVYSNINGITSSSYVSFNTLADACSVMSMSNETSLNCDIHGDLRKVFVTPSPTLTVPRRDELSAFLSRSKKQENMRATRCSTRDFHGARYQKRAQYARRYYRGEQHKQRERHIVGLRRDSVTCPLTEPLPMLCSTGLHLELITK